MAGTFWDSSGQHGFVYSNGTFTTFDSPSTNRIEVSGINAGGQVTGYYYNYYQDTHAQQHFGFVYSNGTFTKLDVPGSSSTSPTSINDQGQVAGYSSHGFIATPMVTDIPTLSQWALLLGGGLLVGMALLAQVRRTRPLQG